METIDVLEDYLKEFRKLVNDCLVTNDESKDKNIKDLFGLKTVEDWNFICVSMDIAERSNSAICNFLRFSLNGPTKYENEGEKFLRLYGVLNAAYLQQEAIKQLRKRFNLEHDEKVDTIRIRDIRNKIGAHSPSQGYREEKKRAYLTVLLSDFKCFYAYYETEDEKRPFTSFPRKDVDLEECLKEHCRDLIEVFDRTYKELIEKFWQEDGSKSDKYTEKLKDLRIKKNGGEVFRINGIKIII